MTHRSVLAVAVSVALVGWSAAVHAKEFGQASSDVKYTLIGDSEPASDEGCCAECENLCACCSPLWTVRAGAVILHRSQPKATPILQNTISGATILDASAFNFNWAGGVDVALVRQWTDCDAFEIRYFGIDGWSAQESFTTPAIWNFPTNPPLFGLGVADINAVYTSRLYSTEVNWRRQANEWLTVLAGFRWIEFHEKLAVNADFGGNQAVISTDTDNHLYGGQLGLDARIWNHNNLTVDAYSKGGIYLNSADQNFGVVQNIGPAFAARGLNDSDAFVGELGISANYWLTDRLALRAGYQLLWLESVAVAADQFRAVNVLDANGIDIAGGAFFHGATCGLEYGW